MRQFQRFCSRERSMKIKGYAFESRVRSHIFYSRPYRIIVNTVYSHIRREVLAAASSDILFQSLECTLASDTLMSLSHSIHRHPDTVGNGTVKRQLGVCSNGA